jgi:GT2 family glycosyltransferase
VDLATGITDCPDGAPDTGHRDARVLVRWLGAAVGTLDVEAPDSEVVAVVREMAWKIMRPELMEAAGRRGGAPPGDAADRAVTELTASATLATPRDAPLVTVAIASYRNVASTVHCVRRVLCNSWARLEVIVVDNDSNHAELDTALQEAYGDEPRVRWLHEPRQGLSFARNAGLTAARGEIVAFTDDDVRVDQQWIEHLLAGFHEADDVACVTGAILPAELETPAQAWLEEYGGFHKGFRRQVFDLTEHKRAGPLYPYNAGQFGSGANMAFRTDVLRDLGGFALDLGAGTPAHGGEDLDVLRRTITAGHTIVYEPSALLWHYHRRSTRALRKQMFQYGVGLSATVTKWLLEDRSTAQAVLRRVPAGLRYLLSPASGKNTDKSSTFPPLLTVLELIGILAGPVAYLRSRYRLRRMGPSGRSPEARRR